MNRSKLALVVVGLLAGCAVGCSGDDDGGSDGAGGAGGTVAGNDAGSDGSGVTDAGASSGGSGSSVDTCPGDIIANWKVDGQSFSSSSLTYTQSGSWGVTLVECKDDGFDAVLVLSHIPLPLALGTYALTSTLNHGAQTTADPGAFYSMEDGAYFTNEAETGELVVTDVDETASRFSATFSFSAIDDAGEKTIAIEGAITDAKFPM